MTMKKIKLFDYQEDMVKRVQEAFRHHDSVMVQMPTGTGKTYLLATLVGLFLKDEVWVIAHRRELVSQIKDTLERFSPSLNYTSDDIEVLVSVDLFSEGFDCPDVEFIQLARPTLSLAKYMQMVGLYKRFGLPSVDRDWQSMCEGRTSLEDILQEAYMQVYKCLQTGCRMLDFSVK